MTTRRLATLTAIMLTLSASAHAQSIQVPVTVDVPITMPNGALTHLTGTGWATIDASMFTLTAPAPAATLPRTSRSALCGIGQSNLDNAVAFFAARGVSLFGYHEGAQPIAYWDADGLGWLKAIHGGGYGGMPISTQQPLSGHTECSAFVMFEGESDDGGDWTAMAAAIVNLVSRVRIAVGNPTLPALLTMLNPQYVGPNIAIESACRQIQGCRTVPTADLSWAYDSRHLDDAGQTVYVSRVLSMVP